MPAMEVPVPLYLFGFAVTGIILLNYKLIKKSIHKQSCSNQLQIFINETAELQQLTPIVEVNIHEDKVEFNYVKKQEFPSVFVILQGCSDKSGKNKISEFLFEGKIPKNTYDIFENLIALPNIAFMVLPSTSIYENILINEDLMDTAELCVYICNESEKTIPDIYSKLNNLLIIHNLKNCTTLAELMQKESELTSTFSLVKMNNGNIMKDNFRRTHAIIGDLQSGVLIEYHHSIRHSIRNQFYQSECYSTTGLYEKFKKGKNIYVNQIKPTTATITIQIASRKRKYMPELMKIMENEQAHFVIQLKFLYDFKVNDITVETIPNVHLLLSGSILNDNTYKQWEYSVPLTSKQYITFIKPNKGNLIYFISIHAVVNILSLNIPSSGSINSYKIIDV